MVNFGRMADLAQRLGTRYSAALVVAVGTAASSIFAYSAAPSVRVIDGDTLQIGETHFRLFGIDAPEESQTCEAAGGGPYACGDASRLALVALIGSSPVTCQPRDTDRYGRTVAICEAGGRDLGAALVESGQAVAYVRYSKRYLPQQAAAQLARRGMWAGSFVMPWDWRKANKAAANAN